MTPNVWMMSILPTLGNPANTATEIELFGWALSVEAKAFLGTINDPMTELVFAKRDLMFKSGDTNYL